MSTLQIPNTSRYRDRSSTISSSSSTDSDEPSSPDSESCHEAVMLKVPQLVSPKPIWVYQTRAGSGAFADDDSRDDDTSARRLISGHSGSLSWSNKDHKSPHIDKIKTRHFESKSAFRESIAKIEHAVAKAVAGRRLTLPLARKSKKSIGDIKHTVVLSDSQDDDVLSPDRDEWMPTDPPLKHFSRLTGDSSTSSWSGNKDIRWDTTPESVSPLSSWGNSPLQLHLDDKSCDFQTAVSFIRPPSLNERLAWQLIMPYMDTLNLATLSQVSSDLYDVCIPQLYNHIHLSPPYPYRCTYRDLSEILVLINRRETLQLLRLHTRSFTISPGWLLFDSRSWSLRDRASSTLAPGHKYCELKYCQDVSSISTLLYNILRHTERISHFSVQSDIPLSPYVLTRLSSVPALTGLSLSLDPDNNSHRPLHQELQQRNGIETTCLKQSRPLFKISLHCDHTPPQQFWWDSLYDLLATSSPHLRHLSILLPHRPSTATDSSTGNIFTKKKPTTGTADSFDTPILRQSRFVNSLTKLGIPCSSASLTLHTLRISGFILNDDFLHFCITSAPGSVLQIDGITLSKSFKPPKPLDWHPETLITDSLQLLSLLHKNSLLIPRNPRTLNLDFPHFSSLWDRSFVSNSEKSLLAVVPKLVTSGMLRSLNLGRLPVSSKLITSILTPASGLKELELKVDPSLWKRFLEALEGMHKPTAGGGGGAGGRQAGLRRLVITGDNLSSETMVGSVGQVRARTPADDAEEMVMAVWKARFSAGCGGAEAGLGGGLRVVGRTGYRWWVEYGDGDKGVPFVMRRMRDLEVEREVEAGSVGE